MIALGDCNNFFASCERSIHPELEGKPLIVLSNNDGCIIARSNEAKALGYKMGEPVFKVKDKLMRDKVYQFSANVLLYRAISRQIMQILASECNAMEVYSIDEAFLGFNGFENYELNIYCKHMGEKIKKWTGIPVSIGLSETNNTAPCGIPFIKLTTKNVAVSISIAIARILTRYSLNSSSCSQTLLLVV